MLLGSDTISSLLFVALLLLRCTVDSDGAYTDACDASSDRALPSGALIQKSSWLSVPIGRVDVHPSLFQHTGWQHGASYLGPRSRSNQEEINAALVQDRGYHPVSTGRGSFSAEAREEAALPLTSRLIYLENRVDTLEEESGEGLSDLKNEVDLLQAKVEAMSNGSEGSLENAGSRATAVEGMLTSMENAIQTQRAQFRTELIAVRAKFDNLGKRLGDQWVSMLQRKQARILRRSPAGLSLVGRTALVEEKVHKLEEESGLGREGIKKQLEELEKTVGQMRAGGVGSLENTAGRVSSSEAQIASLRGSVEAENAEMKNALDDLRGNVVGMERMIGEAPMLLQRASAARTTLKQSGTIPYFEKSTIPAWQLARAVAEGNSTLDSLPQTMVLDFDEADAIVAEAKAAAAALGADSQQGVSQSADESTTTTTTAPVDVQPETSTPPEPSASSTSAVASNISQVPTALPSATSSEASASAALTVNASNDTAGNATPQSSSASTGDAGLPLTRRLNLLEKRIGKLEDNSGGGRFALKNELETLKGTVDATLVGGTTSLSHTTLRVGDTEKLIGELQLEVEQYDSKISADIAEVTSEVDSLDSRVG